MFKKKKLNLLVIICLFMTQIIIADMLSFKAYATEQVYKTQSERQILMQSRAESILIGDVNGDGARNSIDFANMRLVLLGLKEDFDISNGAWAADVDGNKQFSSIDFAYMRKYLLGFINVFPAEEAEVTPTKDPIITPTPTSDKDNEKLLPPQDFHYVTKTESSVTLAWDISEDNISYDIYVDNSYYASTTCNGFIVEGLETNTSYGFSVIAKDDSGNYSKSTEKIVVTTKDTENSYKFKKVTGGIDHTIVLNENGTVWAWGSNTYYQLGNDKEENSSVPIKIDQLSDIVNISASDYYSLALREDGTVWAWGHNLYSVCGVASNIYKVLPTKVFGIKDIEQICATSNISFALSKGDLWVWGKGYIKPTKIEQISDVKSISRNKYNGISAIKNDGSIWESYDGVKFSQILAFNNIENVEKVIVTDLGNYLALKNDGSIWASNGSLSVSNLVPYLNNVKDIESNDQDCIFLLKDGTVYKWENKNAYSHLKSGDKSKIPTQINNLSNILYIGTSTREVFFIGNDGLLVTD